LIFAGMESIIWLICCWRCWSPALVRCSKGVGYSEIEKESSNSSLKDSSICSICMGDMSRSSIVWSGPRKGLPRGADGDPLGSTGGELGGLAWIYSASRIRALGRSGEPDTSGGSLDKAAKFMLDERTASCRDGSILGRGRGRGRRGGSSGEISRS
jgi:hypothetical protein